MLFRFLASLLAFEVVVSADYPNTPESDPPAQWASMSDIFTRHCSPFGISVFAQGWPRDKFVHACNVMAQMLDNDQDGCADDASVVAKMRELQSGMAMFETEDSVEEYIEDIPYTFNFQDLYAEETEPSCSGEDETEDCRDAAIEEILHVISNFGLSRVYPEQFSECCDNSIAELSEMQLQMDIARGGHLESVPDEYPSDAIYHYDDCTCDYGCQGGEFFYWALTSLLNGQDQREQDNSVEWEASTPSDLQTKLPGMYSLLADGGITTMELVSANGVLPGSGGSGAVGTYNPSSQTCTNGCGLDGTGCGDLGNSEDIEWCDCEDFDEDDCENNVSDSSLGGSPFRLGGLSNNNPVLRLFD